MFANFGNDNNDDDGIHEFPGSSDDLIKQSVPEYRKKIAFTFRVL
jgi:hypothetical protein